MRAKIVALVLLALLAIGYLSLAYYSDHANPNPATTYVTHDPHSQEPINLVDYPRKELEVQMEMSSYALFSLWVSGALGVVAIAISLGAFLFSQKQWKEARAQSRKELRAYIHTDITVRGLDSLNDLMQGLTEASNPPIQLIYDVAYQNFGQTPAHQIQISGGVTVAKYPFPNAESFDLTVVSEYAKSLDFKISLGPSAKSNSVLQLKRKLNAEELVAIGLRTHVIWIYGHISYMDSFGEPRVTNFRYAHKILEGKKRFSEDIEAHFQGNDST